MPTWVGSDGASRVALAADCWLSAGVLGQEYKRAIVTAIAPNAQMGATLTAVDEAPSLFPSASHRLLLEGDEAPGFIQLEGDQATGDVLLEGDQAT